MIAGSRLLEWSTADSWVPEAGLWIGVLAVATTGTIWLEHGGSRYLRANAHAGRDFAWLGVCYLPILFLPAGYALWTLVDGPGFLINLYLAACVLCAGWLAFDGGLERLSLETAQFGWAFLVVLCAVLAVVTLESLLSLSSILETLLGAWILEPTVGAVAAVSIQLLALHVGFGEAP